MDDQSVSQSRSSLRRGGSGNGGGKVYRRVVQVDDAGAHTERPTKPAANDKDAVVPFRSSLQESLRMPSKGGKAGRGGGNDASSDNGRVVRRENHPRDRNGRGGDSKERRTPSPGHKRRGGDTDTAPPNVTPRKEHGRGRGRSRSPRRASDAEPMAKEPDQPKKFVSSLARSVSKDERSYGGRGRSGRGGEMRYVAKETQSARHERDESSEKCGASPRRAAPFGSSPQNAMIRRRSSTDSAHSVASHRSDQEKPTRWERKAKSGVTDDSPRPSLQTRRSMSSADRPKSPVTLRRDQDGARTVRQVKTSTSPRDQQKSPKRILQHQSQQEAPRRSVSSLADRAPPSQPSPKKTEQENGKKTLTKQISLTDPNTSAPRKFQSSLASALSPEPKRTNLDAKSPPFVPTQPAMSVTPIVRSSQDVRVARNPPSRQNSPLLSSLNPAATRFDFQRSDSGRERAGRHPQSAQDVRLSATKAESRHQPLSPQPFRSSLAASLKDEPRRDVRAAPAVNPPPAPATVATHVDEAQRQKAKESLQEKFAARSFGRGGSLASMMSRSLSRQDSDHASPRHGAGPSLLRKDSGPPKFHDDKERRTAEFFARQDSDTKKRELANRSAPFKSSLMASISSSISRSNHVIVKKTYSIEELRSLMKFAIPRPADLMDMTIKERIEIRPQSARSIALRSGELMGNSISKAIGGRFGARGGRGQLQKHESSGSRRDERRRGRDGGRGGGKGGRGGGRGGRYGPPPPPLYDGPIEPLQVSENRWVGKKNKEGLEGTISNVKSLLNKLTREKFAKLTGELAKIEMKDLEMLRAVISTIMDKALEEANFADVYADLSKELAARTSASPWKFLRTVSNLSNPQEVFWTATREETFSDLSGPFGSIDECVADSALPASAGSSTLDNGDPNKVKLFVNEEYLISVYEKANRSFYYTKKSRSALTEDEPIVGPFTSESAAREDAKKQTSFKRLLVTRCQVEFEKGKKKNFDAPPETDPEAKRKKEILAQRAKQTMLGNIRFIGELFKVDMVQLSVVQSCIFELLGLELIKTEKGEVGQTVRFPEEDDVEALCKMLGTAGKKFDQPKVKTVMNIIILRLVELSEDKQLSSRARFLIKDLLEMRDHNWEPRRKQLQQKTLEEVRKEAHRLQQMGKNAQHDDLSQRRHKTKVTSAQLAKQSANLLVHAPVRQESQESSAPDSQDVSQFQSRIKSIIQEYLSIVDLEEAATCLSELPVGACRVEFAEQTINSVLEGKASDRENAVNLLVGLYEKGALDAASIQLALLNVVEFLEDMRIDIPLIHEHSGLVFGRLIASGCFGLSWMISDALGHLIQSGLTSLVFAEALSVIDADTDEATVVRMLADEEIKPSKVLPKNKARDENEVKKYLHDNDLDEYFNPHSDDEDEGGLDPETAVKMRSTLEEYLQLKDIAELVLCVQEFKNCEDKWKHFAHLCLLYGLDSKPAARAGIATLMVQLVVERKELSTDDLMEALELIFLDYEDMRVDIPQVGANIAEMTSPLFQNKTLSVSWLAESCAHMVARGMAAEVLAALLDQLTAGGMDTSQLTAWWQSQTNGEGQQPLLTRFTATNASTKLDKWVTALTG
ncbi:TPA: hypothetical protein N0F65_008955 [Lagenidium giganteum]|uniref:MI domain-containing protein n=1 Tax=Lagenidium giganteum TaxID=4803 RepID=A0AAV2YTN3_9STRA|nr:TPA: hypothetical protein N0F65_008955 [Lagenidium giganteum]